jgi:hypothetical protein
VLNQLVTLPPTLLEHDCATLPPYGVNRVCCPYTYLAATACGALYCLLGARCCDVCGCSCMPHTAAAVSLNQHCLTPAGVVYGGILSILCSQLCLYILSI